MSVSVTVKPELESFELAELKARLTPERLNAAVGPAAARLLQRHLRGLGKNKRGWPTTNFWARAAKATSWQVMSEGALVSINQIGVRQRYHGGPISPEKKKALAIPISPVSYGHVPSDFPGLFLLRTKKGAYLVQYGDGEVGRKATKAERAGFVRGLRGNAQRRRRATLNFLFKLSGGVTQKGNPGVLPDKAVMAAELKKVIVMAVMKSGRKGPSDVS